MQILKRIAIIILIIQLAINQIYCQSNTCQKEVDRQKKKNSELEAYLKSIETQMPNVLINVDTNGSFDIRLYRPFGLQMELTWHRPEINNEVFFCIPAAYTTRDTTIDGFYVFKGLEITTELNQKLTGACIIDGNNIQIISKEMIDSLLIKDVKVNSKSFFQQSLLVCNSTIVPCTLFKEKKNVRRALIKFANYNCIGESTLPVTIREFQESLIQLGAIDAIYLDMGTWSEGWYKDSGCNAHRIGEKFNNTHLQTNWLIFKRK